MSIQVNGRSELGDGANASLNKKFRPLAPSRPTAWRSKLPVLADFVRCDVSGDQRIAAIGRRQARGCCTPHAAATACRCQRCRGAMTGGPPRWRTSKVTRTRMPPCRRRTQTTLRRSDVWNGFPALLRIASDVKSLGRTLAEPSMLSREIYWLPLIRSAARSAIMIVGALVLAPTSRGITDASITRNP